MGWVIRINSIGLELVIDGKHRRIEGARTSQEVNSPANEPNALDFCNQLSNTECVWMITPSSTPISTYCFSSEEEDNLSETLNKSENNTAARIKNNGENHPSIGIWIVVSQEAFDEIWDLCKLLYADDFLYILIEMNFVGFKREGVVHPAPSISEFKKGKSYYCDNVFIKMCNKSTGNLKDK